ncbi:hypothetical protein [Desulfatitalea alkaliphila]|uniref:Uncharacterized protein n=1 Tax=Desulfatitalea alkaliphila TaxID=2929485 RepID=A0AA41UM60_9BACT|nr:hypothetical protein [Desulfatitalea alkaliphila]MCJ8502291.1 hypothetical protein [Desulfatitalea alkaliphila]
MSVEREVAPATVAGATRVHMAQPLRAVVLWRIVGCEGLRQGRDDAAIVPAGADTSGRSAVATAKLI